MPEFIQTFISGTISENPAVLTWSVASVLLLFALISEWKNIREWFGEFRLDRQLKKLGREAIHDVVIPDDVDGSIYVEHLILTPEKILLLAVKRFRGIIFAAENIDLWTQVVGKKSYKFENPLHQLQSNVLAFRNMLDTPNVDCKIVFIQGSQFPKGKPENIMTLNELKELKSKHVAEEIPAELRTAWKKLIDIAVVGDGNSARDISLDEKSKLTVLGVMLILATISWLIWRHLN